jgi:LysR family transcriptional regulator, glycine cleavage system transcriptional activator
MDTAMPPLQWLLTFKTVMEEGSFAGAARRLNLTPSAISHQMRALEHRLGQNLFLRDRRIVTPTEEAMTYAASISESFAHLASATGRLMASGAARRLPIHCSPSFATLWLSPRLGQFLARHPAIDITLFASHEPARLGQDGILIDIQYARPVPENCVSVPLGEELVVPLASPALVQRVRLNGVSDLAHIPLIHSVRSVVPWEQWSARYAPRTPLNPRGLQFDRAHLALAAASDGLGIVLESTLQAHGHLRRGDLVMPFGRLGISVLAHRLVYRRENRGNPEIEAFVSWFQQAVADMSASPVFSLEDSRQPEGERWHVRDEQ